MPFPLVARKGFSLTRAKQQYCLLKQHPREARAVLEFYAGVVLAETQDVLVCGASTVDDVTESKATWFLSLVEKGEVLPFCLQQSKSLKGKRRTMKWKRIVYLLHFHDDVAAEHENETKQICS